MKKYPFVISLPHCAGHVPPEIRPRMALTDEQIDDAVDQGTHEIFAALPADDVIAARYSRLFCDLNRSPENRRGKGVVPETDYKGRRVFLPEMVPDNATVDAWVARFYRPYHERLEKAVSGSGAKALFDCHSLNGVGPAAAPDAGRKRKDVIISNNGQEDGKAEPALGEPTCSPDILDIVESAFSRAGFTTAVNNPYTGGFITVHYGKKLVRQGGFALQIEMNQDLYVDPETDRCDPEKTKTAAEMVESALEEIVRRVAVFR